MPQTYKAGGNINPARFVKFSADKTVVLCGAGEKPCGISAPWSRRLPAETDSPLYGIDDGYTAISGENVTVYTSGDKDVVLELGGTVTYGQRVKSDASGAGVAASTDKDQYGAITPIGGASGELVYVNVEDGEVSV